MTREEMLKLHWKAYREIMYQHPRSKEPVLCILLGIDFDDESMTLQPLGDGFITKDFTAGIQFCSIPKKKMKVITVNGKKVSNDELPDYTGNLDAPFHGKNPKFKDSDDDDYEDAS